MAKYRLYFSFRWKAQELGWGDRTHEFECQNDTCARKFAATFLQNKSKKISYEFRKLTKVEETIVASKALSKRLERR
jgi:hypothetical protein